MRFSHTVVFLSMWCLASCGGATPSSVSVGIADSAASPRDQSDASVPVTTEETGAAPAQRTQQPWCRSVREGAAEVECDHRVVSLDDRIRFAVNRARIEPVSYGQLDDVVQILAEQPRLRLSLSGHLGFEQEPMGRRLSHDRARVVLEYLVEHGVDRQRLVSCGFESSQPIVAFDENELSLRINGRVDFALVAPDEELRCAVEQHVPWCQGLRTEEIVLDCQARTLDAENPVRDLPILLRAYPRLRLLLHGALAGRLARRLHRFGVEADRIIACPTIRPSIDLVAPGEQLVCPEGEAAPETMRQ